MAALSASIAEVRTSALRLLRWRVCPCSRTRTGRFRTDIFESIANLFGTLDEPITAIPDTCITRVQTCELLLAFIPHGGRPRRREAHEMQAALRGLPSNVRR
jgi:hypothetical protein